jgi:hypothetical protein
MNQPTGCAEVHGNAASIWTANVSNVVETVPQSAVQSLLGIIKKWQRLFPLANTWVGRQFGVPSLFVRADFVLHNGEARIYEIEDRPCGFGVATQINPFFFERATAIRQKWPEIRWVKSDYRVTDDEPFFGPPLTLEEAMAQVTAKVLVRSRPEESKYHVLEDRSVSTVSKEGDKRYGIPLGLWHPVTAKVEEGYDGRSSSFYLDPPLTEPCVLKPTQGTRAKLVKVFYPHPHPQNKKPRTDVITGGGEIESIGRLTKLVSKQPCRQMFCQRFIPPMRFPHQSDKNGIYRLMFGFDPSTWDWKPLGGLWNALDRLVVHGTEETTLGPLVCEE